MVFGLMQRVSVIVDDGLGGLSRCARAPVHMASYSAVGVSGLSTLKGSVESEFVPCDKDLSRCRSFFGVALRQKNRRFVHQGFGHCFISAGHSTPRFESQVSRKRCCALQGSKARRSHQRPTNSPSYVQFGAQTGRGHRGSSHRVAGKAANVHGGNEPGVSEENDHEEIRTGTEENSNGVNISSQEANSNGSGIPTPRFSRRMLLGAVAVGFSAYSSWSSEGATAADKGFNLPLTKGSWFLGEADLAPPGAAEKKGSRVYDATVLGEPVTVGSDKDRVWQKLLAARVVYLGEAEGVVDPDDQLLELEIVRTARDKCFEQARGVTLALEAFPIVVQPQLNLYMNKKITDEELRAFVSTLPDERWQRYLPILQYCRDNGVRLVSMGPPSMVIRTVQANGVQALDKAAMQKFVPPIGGGYKFKSFPKTDDSESVDLLPNASGRSGPGPYRFAQARVVADYCMSQVIAQVIKDGGAVGLTIVITGASHVKYGSRGMGLPAWTSKSLQKRTQAVILLNPERQHIRKEGDLPEADFLWYSAAKVCTRNCFDRVEVARVMGAAGRRREALPQDLQLGLERGLVAPEVLESFFKLDEQPLMAELTSRFQGLRERWLADPRFLHRLAIEETISITTTLIAQYERRGDRFWKELDYVTTDTIRGAVVDFFTVWLPAPRLSFRPLDPKLEDFNALESLKGLLGSFPDNAFQRSQAGVSWGVGERVGAILVGGVKLFGVGFISSLGTLAVTNFVLSARQRFSKDPSLKLQNKRSPVLKTALVYASFLGTSANLRYQIIAGVVEHWIADYWLASQPLAGNVLSFVARTANSYFGTGQWVDLARFAGLQAHNVEEKTPSQKEDLEQEEAITVEFLDSNSTSNSASNNGSSSVEEPRELVKEPVKIPKQ